MSETVPTPAPNDAAAAYDAAVAAPAPAAQPAPPDVGQNAPPAAAPVPPIDAAAVESKVAPYQQAEVEATKRASDIANKPVVDPTVPHAKLMAIIQAIGIGMSAFGAAGATGGREGGAPMVQKFEAGQQEMKIRGHEARVADKNNQIQQQMTIADTNHRLAQSIILMSTLPTDLAMKDLQLSKEQTEVAAGKAAAAQTQAEFMSTYGLSTDAFNTMMSPGAKGAPADPKAVQSMTAFAQQKIDAAGKILRPDDPYLTKAQQVLADPKSTPQDIFGAVSSVNRQVGLQEQVQKARTAKEAAEAGSPVAKLSTPEALAAPGAQAAIQAKINDPNTDPADRVRLYPLIAQAGVAQWNAQKIKEREARATQLIAQGDPDAAGKMLASRTMTMDELKLRNATPQFMVAAVKAAQKYDPSFKAPNAAAQAAIARSATNQQFFGNTDSLLIKDGTLDQLDVAGKNLGNVQIPAYNTLDNWRKAAWGEGPQAAYAAAALGVADDYSKVMTGGQGSDTSRLQALTIIAKNLSPEGRGAAINQIRQAVESQRNGRVGTNPYLRDMYPDPALTRTMYAAAPGKPRLMSTDGGKTWQPAPTTP